MLIMLLLALMFIGFWLGQAQDCMQSCMDFVNENFDLKVEEETEKDLLSFVNDMEVTAGELTYIITVDNGDYYA